jgi:SSS family solute:Na+ symporter
MRLIDWLIMSIPLFLVLAIGLYTRRYVRSVADFMAGGRNAGRYLLCIAGNEALAGAALFVAAFEQFSQAGFTMGWWNQILVPVGLITAVTGFVGYRYRQTRAFTLAQFFEMRYSRSFRLFAGMLGFAAGIVNFGVIPAVGARFFVNFLGLPASVHLFAFPVPTYMLLMTCFLGTSVLLTTTGGQITILVTNTIEGMFSQFFYVIIAIVMICTVSWTQMTYVLMRQPEGHSLVNPFHTFSAKDFNLWFVLMLAFNNVYGTGAWQNNHAFRASGKTPHDGRMGSILGIWRYFASGVMVTILAVCTLTFLQHPDFAAGAAHARELTARIPDARVAQQMAWPIALSLLLPAGVKGMLCAIILMGVISGDGMHLHSWSSILIQDVIVPLRKRPFSIRQHLFLLRAAIVGVALFAYIFGALVAPTDKLLLYWALTQGIFVGGAGVAIIGGLYWSRGTTAAAWSGMIIGSALSFGGLAVRQLLPHFPLNGMQISFCASLIGITVYVLVSLLTCRVPHDMDKLLNRGIYAVEPEDPGKAVKRVSLLNRIIGIDEHFSRGDRWVTIGISGWSFFWFFFFIIGSIVYLIHPWPDAVWTSYWHVTTIWMPLVIGIGTTLWFTIGCVSDLRDFFHRLRTEKIDSSDDGTVRHAAEPAPAEPVAIH